MAAPVIDSITNDPDPAEASTTITIVAHHPDDKTVTVDVVVRDSDGDEVTGQLVFPSVHALTYGVTADSGTVLPGGSPNVFTWSE